MIAFDLQTQEPLEVVLAALRARAGEWRESQIPSALRSAGVLGIESRAEGATITLRYERSWYGLGGRGQSLRARATVFHVGASTRVHVEVDYHIRGLNYGLLAGAVEVSVLTMLIRDPWVLLLVLFPASMFVAVRAWSRHVTRSMSRSDPDADYLVRRIEAAILGTPAVLAG
jgi:hypothetical protein